MEGLGLVLGLAKAAGVSFTVRDGDLRAEGERSAVASLIPLLRQHRDALHAALLPWCPPLGRSGKPLNVSLTGPPPPGVDPGEWFFPRGGGAPALEEPPVDSGLPLDTNTPVSALLGGVSVSRPRLDPEGEAIQSVEREEEYAYPFHVADWSDSNLDRALRRARRDKPASDYTRALEAEAMRRRLAP